MENNVLHSTAAVTVAVLTKKTAPPPRHPNDVDFEVKYPEDYKGPRFMKEGITVMSSEVAADFTKRGLGKVVGSTDQGNGEEVKASEEVKPKPLVELTKAELQEKLTEAGIKFKDSAKNEELISLLEAHSTDQGNGEE